MILDLQNLKKSYSRTILNPFGKRDIENYNVLDGVTLKVAQGSITTLLGGNGSGKSTLFNIIGGYLGADSGEIIFQNRYRLEKLSAYQIARLGIGRMFQGTHIFKNMTILENMQVADEVIFGEKPFINLLYPKSVKKIDQQQVQDAENIWQMLLGKDNFFYKKRNELAGTLSYGQQRLLAFARLLMNENLQLILLDEPCAGINQDIQEIIKKILIILNKQGKTILLIEHNLEFVINLSDYCFYLDNGKIVAEGTYYQISQDESFRGNFFQK